MKDMIYILVEDTTDVKFMEQIIEPFLERKYHQIIYFKYARKKKTKFKKFIEVIHKINADYFLIGDYDESSNMEACLSNINKKCDNIANVNNIIAVIKEIESWYLSGIPDFLVDQFNIDISLDDTEQYYKEDIISLKHSNLSPLIFLSIIISKYNIEKAVQRNDSLNRFINLIN